MTFLISVLASLRSVTVQYYFNAVLLNQNNDVSWSTVFAPRIVGGTTVSIEATPYQVSLHTSLKHFCGGSIISNMHIVTAAHCTQPRHHLQLFVRAGSSFQNEEGVVSTVCKIIEHPLYDNVTVDYDVSILFLFIPLTYNNMIQPIAMANEGLFIPPQTSGLITGWGRINEKAPKGEKELRGAFVTIVELAYCKNKYGAERITSRMLCAGNYGRDSCQGDSGGPLAVNRILVGIVSWGSGCARPGVFGIYTDIRAVRPFIRQVTGV